MLLLSGGGKLGYLGEGVGGGGKSGGGVVESIREEYFLKQSSYLRHGDGKPFASR